MTQEKILKEIERNKKYLISFCDEMKNLVLKKITLILL